MVGSMKIQRTFAVLVLCAGFSGGLLAQSTLGRDDESIFVAVEQALQRTPSLAGADITVHSREGFVTLSGVARTVKDIARAGKIALGVRGVIGVSNELRITDRESRG